MLYKRELPKAEADDLAKVYAVKIKFLCWLLNTPPQGLITQQILVKKFKSGIGSWLWGRIFDNGKVTKFGKAVNGLAAKARNEVNAAKQVAIAIEQDARFAECWDASNFELQFPLYYSDWLKPVKAVASPFYDWLGSMGFASAVFGLYGGDMSRARIMDAFWSLHPKVCGYCDGPAGDKSETTQANDCDHFFPRSKWPHLAIHPRNLFSACLGCNRTWKNANKPMGEGNVNGLADTYHPQLRPGVNTITVTANTSPNNPRHVVITLNDTGLARRATTIDETLQLKSRWTNDANASIDGEGVSVFVAENHIHLAQGHALSVNELNVAINASIAWCQNKRGKRARMIQQEAVLRYQQANRLAEILHELQ
jgi:hypothetical protein